MPVGSNRFFAGKQVWTHPVHLHLKFCAIIFILGYELLTFGYELLDMNS